jgi:preprotein translocase subunit SecG
MADKKRTTSKPLPRPSASGPRPANRVIEAPQKSKTPLIVISAVVALALIVVVIILASGGDDKTASPSDSTVAGAEAAVVAKMTSIPAATFDAVAAVKATSVFKKITSDAITVDGKPEVLYIGGEFCPYCAAQRWPMVAALSRFGTFSGIGLTRSAKNDGDIATLTFRNATYTSQYLAFTPIENVDVDHKVIKAPTDAQHKLWVAINGQESYPFIDVGGKYAITTTFVPTILSGQSQTEIAVNASDPATPVGKAILSSANQFTATICALTNNQPSTVCDAPGVKAEAANLPTT